MPGSEASGTPNIILPVLLYKSVKLGLSTKNILTQVRDRICTKDKEHYSTGYHNLHCTPNTIYMTKLRKGGRYM